ncbi:MAG: CHAT domain-containing protein, partial [Okeania sp. SIO2D1]|nr:CHAT domain-containing protein [Okeania sp. SIO2D1]
GIAPALSLIDTRERDLQKVEVLAMGAEEFSDPEHAPLPSVPFELETITGQLWPGRVFLNEEFTLTNLQNFSDLEAVGIIHLATHGEFRAEDISESYIQLSDRKLSLAELKNLGLENPLVELMVLSACHTALGDRGSEFGFAGLAVAAGVKSALGSLWYVSDEATLTLMTSFYGNLRDAPIKAEALRQAQLAMIRGQARLEGGKLITEEGSFDLPPQLVALGDRNFEHPYYWSGFTMIGNPW